MTLSYRGDADTRPEVVRLRAASRRASLGVREISLRAGRLATRGDVTSRARGLVRFRLSYLDAAGRPQVHTARARIRRNGDWRVTNNRVPAQAARCGGYLSVLFTGYLPRRVRGEMLAYEIGPNQTRRP